jgi:hypothetical protein
MYQLKTINVIVVSAATAVCVLALVLWGVLFSLRTNANNTRAYIAHEQTCQHAPPSEVLACTQLP